MYRWAVGYLSILFVFASVSAANADVDKTAALEALVRATKFMRSISQDGGFAGIYSADLSRRFSEDFDHPMGPEEIWIQPPGTPSVGLCFLRAYLATDERLFKMAALEVSDALLRAQVPSGGWYYVATVPGDRLPADSPATLDDNVTQGALAFLMELARVEPDSRLEEHVHRGLDFLMRVQFPNGAWPQAFPRSGTYSDYYTFNDRAINNSIRILLRAHVLFGDPAYRSAALRGGSFIVASQLVDPRAGWAEQYSHDMRAAPARVFEPAALSSVATSNNIRTLVTLYETTLDKEYLRSAGAGIDWLRRVSLDEDRWARYYDIETNEPLYLDRDGKIYSNLDDIPTTRFIRFGWEGSFGIEDAISLYDRALAGTTREDSRQSGQVRRWRQNEEAVSMIIDAVDEEGRWTRDGYIHIRDFVRNCNTLVRYLRTS